MVYIFNKYVQGHKTIKSALTITYGVGFRTALCALQAQCIGPNQRVHGLTPTQISRLCRHISANYQIGSFLHRRISENIRRLAKIRSYKGYRHKNCLPVRGQRTHTNARTQKKCGGLSRT